MSLSNNKIKYFKSLKEKKFRNQYNCFVAEGEKIVFDLMGTCKCQLIAALPDIISLHDELTAEEIIVASEGELKRATSFKSQPSVIAVFYQLEFNEKEFDLYNILILFLDEFQDLGNLETFVRLAIWLG